MKMRTTRFGVLLLVVSSAFSLGAAAQSRRPQRPAAPAPAKKPAPKPSSDDVGDASAPSTGKANAEAPSKADAKLPDGGTKGFRFGEVEVEGRLKSPQIVYFLRRVRAEFAAGDLGHRSFMSELGETKDEPSF